MLFLKNAGNVFRTATIEIGRMDDCFQATDLTDRFWDGTGKKRTVDPKFF
jgi:hypothetical protein